MNASACDAKATSYVSAVLALYLGLPETPLRASAQDQNYARQLNDQNVPLPVVESASLLGLSASITPACRRTAAVAHSVTGVLPARHR